MRWTLLLFLTGCVSFLLGVGEIPGSFGQEEPAVDTEQGHRIKVNAPTEEAFDAFKGKVRKYIDKDRNELVIESDGLPEHSMMVGIRVWQQQVPIPQPYHGDNAWRLPLHPTISSSPISVLRKPMRGAIAIAVNGVPIFCALNNRGDDAFLFGELDQWGGHCGRGDDYHYHIAPIHLEEKVGKGNPIAFALDGFPIFGLTEADGSKPVGLDSFNGHFDDDENYHYHATENFPYLIGGLKGKVTIAGDQVKQPRDSPTRPPQLPLRGARITYFQRDGDRFEVGYDLEGRRGEISYVLLDDEQVEFTETRPNGQPVTSVYRRGQAPPPIPWTILALCGVGIAGAGYWYYRRRW